MQVLTGHTSAETAYVVDDYPYGFTLRCKIRYWLEYHPKKGFRFISQTTNPKKSFEVWNKPKASTYMRLGGVMYLDDKNHVHWHGISEYDDTDKIRTFLEGYGHAMPKEACAFLAAVIKGREAYERRKAAMESESDQE